MTLAEELRALAERQDMGRLELRRAIEALAARAEREQAEAVDAATSHIIGPAGPVRLGASDDPDGCTITLYDEGKPVTRIGLSEWRRLEREQSPEREAFVKAAREVAEDCLPLTAEDRSDAVWDRMIAAYRAMLAAEARK